MGKVFDKALSEYIEFFDFHMEIARLPIEEMLERMAERDPSFMEHIETMENPPKDALELWSGFGIWTVTSFRAKYHHFHKKLVDAFFHSDATRQISEKYELKETVESQLALILKVSGFDKE